MLEMLPGRGNDFEARIPSRYMVGSKVKYYFQAEDRTGQVLATLGSRRRPYELRLEGDTLGADSFASGSSLDGSDNSFSSGRKYFGMSLGLGTGFGWVTLFAKPHPKKASLKEAGLAIAPCPHADTARFLVNQPSHSEAMLGFNSLSFLPLVVFECNTALLRVQCMRLA